MGTGGIPPATLAALKAAVGEGGAIDEPGRMAPYLQEWRGLFQGSAEVVLLPPDTAAASRVVGICAAGGIGIVPQGGNTGLVGGAIPHSTAARPQVVLGAARLNRIRQLDPENHTVTAEAGCVIATLQAAAAGAGRLFPLSLASEGSCQLGGVVSTNAGGTAVMRYGTMRDLVLGLEVVLPDGAVLDALRVLRKDNTGYDLRQLFIGAEGTLGFVTAVSCRLFPAPHATAVAWLALPSAAAAIALLSAGRAALGDEVTAFELMARLAVELVIRHIPGTRDPLPGDAAWYVLVEVASSRAAADPAGGLEQFLADSLARGLIQDCAIAQSGAQQAAWWRIRHAISEAQKHAGASIKHDISVPVARVPEFLSLAGERVARSVPGVRIVAFGHVGDGNLHFNLSQPPAMPGEEFLAQWESIAAVVHGIAEDLGGSFSAEHGVGSLKVADLQRFRGGASLRVMQAIKAAIDPRGIMNPGKVLPNPD